MTRNTPLCNNYSADAGRSGGCTAGSQSPYSRRSSRERSGAPEVPRHVWADPKQLGALRLDGRFKIESAPGKGTRATVVAPMRLKTTAEAVSVALEIAAPAGPVGSNGQAPGKVRVLPVDDHAVVRDGLDSLLQRQTDIEVVGQAADGRQAVDLGVQLRPDVIVMDVNMPVLDGKEATRQIVARLPGVKVIGLSMFAEADVAESMKAAGAQDFIGSWCHRRKAGIGRPSPGPGPRSWRCRLGCYGSSGVVLFQFAAIMFRSNTLTLPSQLKSHSGLYCGIMVVEFHAAAMVLRSKTLTLPSRIP